MAALEPYSNPFAGCVATRSARPTSVVHTLGDFGQLHAGSLPFEALKALRQTCGVTSCDAIHTHATALFDPVTLALLHQTDEVLPHQTALAKLADGYVYYAPTLNNKVLSILKDAPMCVPPGTPLEDVQPISPDGARSVFYSIVSKRSDSPASFKLVFHDGYTAPHEISRMSLVDHAIAQVASAVPLASAARVIMQSDGLGALMGQMLTGDDARTLKGAFMGLIQQASARGGGGSIYNAPIETSRLMAKLLQLENLKGQFSLARLRDGLLGYRTRKDGHKSFLFLANSDDFHAHAPSDEGQVQVYKMLYADPSPRGNRIFVNVEGPVAFVNGNNNSVMSNNRVHSPSYQMEGASPCPMGTPYIRPDQHTVQNVLGIIEGALRRSGRTDYSCHEYPKLCEANAVEAIKSGEIEEAHPAMQDALHGVLSAMDANPPPSMDDAESAMRAMSRG
jgi:hypothetical protein